MSSDFPLQSGAGRPAQMQDYLNAAQSALGAGDSAQALRISAEAAQRGFEHPGMLALAVYHFLDLGQTQRALKYAARARELAPRQGDVLNALGQTFVKLGRYRDALKIFDEALRYSPTSFVSHFNKANSLVEVSELKRARDHFLRALALKPGHVESITQIAHLAAQRGDGREAREYGARALKADPRQVYAAFALATADMIDKNYEAALAILKPIAGNPALTAIARATAQSMLGDALDGVGRSRVAFDAYTLAGEGFRTAYAPVYARAGQITALALAGKLERYFRDASLEPWGKASLGHFKSPVKTHVFLLSFPRSGTTLLGQVLAAHPLIQTMEERSCLDGAHSFVLEAGGLDRLAALDGAALDGCRAAYWKRVSDEEEGITRPVFVDKLPLNSVLLCLVAKLFPDAKILFALRDPRDVVLSCFRRRFGMNVQMYELLTLESAAAYYDAVFSLCEVYRKKLALDIFDVRYEELVADIEQATHRLCEFLGISHDPLMREFAPPISERHIDTPSAAQVARGLFADGQGRWRNYRQELSSTMPIITPWVSRLGYPTG